MGPLACHRTGIDLLGVLWTSSLLAWPQGAKLYLHAANNSPPTSLTIWAVRACAEHACPLDLEAGRERDQTEQHRIEVWHRARGAAQRHVSFAARFVSLPHRSLGLGQDLAFAAAVHVNAGDARSNLRSRPGHQ